MKKYLFSKKGVSFTEIVVAALLVTIVFTGISVMFMNAVRQMEMSTKQLQALYLAKEGIEIWRDTVMATEDDWEPQPTASSEENWITLPYWSVGDAETPEFPDESREYKIVDVDVAGQEGYLRCIDVKVEY